jgi:hypothetical protein
VFDVVEYKQIARGMSFRAAGSHMFESHSYVHSDRKKFYKLARGMSFRTENIPIYIRDTRTLFFRSKNKLRESRCEIQDTGYLMLDIQYVIFDADCSKLNIQSGMCKIANTKKNGQGILNYKFHEKVEKKIVVNNKQLSTIN